MSAQLDVERWLREKTFSCALGRVSPAQCERNRNRPGLFDQHERVNPLNGPSETYKPAACTNCRDWERFCQNCRPGSFSAGEIDQAAGDFSGPEDQPTTPISEISMDSQPVGATLKCGCGAEFAPYKHGALVVKKLCPRCFYSRHSATKKADAAPSDRAARQAGCEAASHISIDFPGQDERLFKRIEELARNQRRTMEAQVLYWLENMVPELREEA